MTTAYTIAQNAQFNSIEISFTTKPSEEVREALKGLRFRWHHVKKVWYGYTTEEAARQAIDTATGAQPAPIQTAPQPAKEEKPAAENKPVSNKFGVQVGDIFSASWGYEQTNVDFFQVVALVGASSVRVREVCPQMVKEEAVCSMAADRTYKIDRALLPAASYSVFIKDQEKGDIKRLKSYDADGVSNPQFRLDTFASAYYCAPGSLKTYESWYA